MMFIDTQKTNGKQRIPSTPNYQRKVGIKASQALIPYDYKTDVEHI